MRFRCLLLLPLGFCATLHMALAQAVTDPLYGDPTHPHFAGMWNPEFAYFGPPVGSTPGAAPAFPPRPPGGAIPAAFMPQIPELTDEYASRFAQWQKDFETGEQEPDIVTRCLAFGIARFGTMPVEIIQTPGQITMNLGVIHDIRRIYLDGNGHTRGADPSFNGDSVGHWEGDTLVVETNNIRAATLDRNGVPYSDKLTVLERIKLVNPQRMEIEMTLTDPEAFKKPFIINRAYVPMPPGSRFEEYVCENNQDV